MSRARRRGRGRKRGGRGGRRGEREGRGEGEEVRRRKERRGKRGRRGRGKEHISFHPRSSLCVFFLPLELSRCTSYQARLQSPSLLKIL